MDRRPRLRERASSRSSRRRVPALGSESLVRQDFPRHPRQGMFVERTFKLQHRSAVNAFRFRIYGVSFMHNKATQTYVTYVT